MILERLLFRLEHMYIIQYRNVSAYLNNRYDVVLYYDNIIQQENHKKSMYDKNNIFSLKL